MFLSLLYTYIFQQDNQLNVWEVMKSWLFSC